MKINYLLRVFRVAILVLLTVAVAPVNADEAVGGDGDEQDERGVEHGPECARKAPRKSHPGADPADVSGDALLFLAHS